MVLRSYIIISKETALCVCVYEKILNLFPPPFYFLIKSIILVNWLEVNVPYVNTFIRKYDTWEGWSGTSCNALNYLYRERVINHDCRST